MAFTEHATKGTDSLTLANSLQAVVSGLPAAFLAFVLPVAAGATDLSRP
jgi:hypothetical protein